MVKQHPVTKRFMKDADYEALMEQQSKPKGKRGGKREGAGRPGLEGTRRKLTITLPDEVWAEIDEMISQGKYESSAHYFRTKELQSEGTGI